MLKRAYCPIIIMTKKCNQIIITYLHHYGCHVLVYIY